MLAVKLAAAATTIEAAMATAANIDLGHGLYGGIDIDRYVALQLNAPLRSTARRWLRDILANSEHVAGRPDFDFNDLISAFAVAELRQQGVSMQKVRLAHARLIELIDSDRPMAYQGLYTDGVDVFADLNVSQQLTRLTLGDPQEAAREPLELKLSRVQFEQGDGMADRPARSWEPMEGISINPRVVFGAPCIGRHRLTTQHIAGMIERGYSRETVARDYELSHGEIEQALRFEERLQALSAA